jgi:hypothetical protein
VHSDGLTQNALIVLCDGVYIELIEFLDKPSKDSKEKVHEFRERRSKHWWWGTKTGWVDWCLAGGVKDKRVASINQAHKLASQRHKDDTTSPKPDLVESDISRGIERSQREISILVRRRDTSRLER